jgi:rubredoxin
MRAHGGPVICLTGVPPINHPTEGVEPMQKWRCVPCDYVYDPEKGDPENGIAPGTAFEDLPEDWVCPDCGAGKDLFEKVE